MATLIIYTSILNINYLKWHFLPNSNQTYSRAFSNVLEIPSIQAIGRENRNNCEIVLTVLNYNSKNCNGLFYQFR